MTVYRMHRGPALMISGALAVVAAVAVFASFILLQFDGAPRVIGWVLAAVAVVTVSRAVWLGVRPPAVLKMDESGFQLRAGNGVAQAAWLDVKDVTVVAELVRIETGATDPIVIPLGVIDEPRRAVLLRDLRDHLNTANGYERFNLS